MKFFLELLKFCELRYFFSIRDNTIHSGVLPNFTKNHNRYLITGECPWPKLHYTRLLIEWKVGDINRTRTLQRKIRRLLVLSIKTIIIQYLQYIAKYLSVAQCEFTTPHNAKNSKGIEWLGKLEQSAISKLYLCISSTYRVHREKHYNITRHLFSCNVKFLSMHRL